MAMIERSLAATGLSITTITTDDDGSGRHRKTAIGIPQKENGVERIYFRKNTEFYKFSFGLARWLSSEIQKFDVLHVHALFSHASVCSARTALRKKIPFIIRPLGVLNEYGLRKRRALLKRLSLACFERPLLSEAAAVHFTDEVEKREAEKLGIPFRSVVIPLGIDPVTPGTGTRFITSYPMLAHSFRVLFLSRLDPKKNLEGLIDAIAILVGEGRDVVLIVCGAGAPAYAASLRQRAAAKGIGDRVLWTGHQSGIAKADVLACADVLALPSFSENFGLSCVEAMHAGLPLILGKGVALSGRVSEVGAGYAVSPESEAIASGIRSFMNNEQARLQAGLAGKRLAAREYSSALMAKNLVELYRELTKQKIQKQELF